MSHPWATPEAVVARVRRRWDDGSLLRAYAEGAAFPVVEVALRGPSASEIGEDITAVRDWIALLDAGRRDDTRYQLEWKAVGGRHVGRNRVPARALVTGFDQAWALLGAGRDVHRFDELLTRVAAVPRVREWVLSHPHRALDLATEWSRLLAAYAWLDDHRGSDRYLREISAPGVDTKFAERHRAVLAGLLGVPGSAAGFLAGLGLRSKPDLVRVRVSAGLGLPAPLSEVAVRPEELAELELAPRSALVLENEITYLSAEVPDEGVVIWGKGFHVDRVGRLPWLAGVPVRYWGDLDTHGFAILDRLRAWLPQVESVLMDRGTLLEHRDRWVSEDRPTVARLRHLHPQEEALYADLVSDRYALRLRLEQERVDWGWASARLTTAAP